MAYTDTFVFYHEWRPGSSIKEKWNTEILTAKDGSEQRRARLFVPRYEYNVVVYLNQKEINRINNALWAERHLKWMLPIWPEFQIVASISAGATSISVGTDYVRYSIGEYLFIFESYEKYEAIEITSPSPGSDTVYLNEQVQGNYTNAYVMPARLVYMEENPTRSTTGRTGEASFTFKQQPGETDPPPIPLYPPPTFIPEPPPGPPPPPLPPGFEYGGLPWYQETTFGGPDVRYVIWQQPDKVNQFMPEVVKHRVDELDYGYGDTEYITPWTYPKLRRELKYQLHSLEDYNYFQRYFHYFRGRQRTFRVPSFEQDFRLVDNGHINYAITFYDDFQQTYNRLQLELEDNQIWVALVKPVSYFGEDYGMGFDYQQVDSYSNNGNGTFDLNFINDLDIPFSDLRAVHYLPIYRLDTDEIEYKFYPSYPDRRIEINIPVLQIPYWVLF